MSEHREKICKLLTELLRETHDHYDVLQIEYRADRGLAYIHYSTGTQVPVEVEVTDTVMLAKIINRIIEKEHTYTSCSV